MPKAPQDNISRSLKHLSLGMRRQASHLSSSTIIGQYQLNLSFCFLLVRIMFCIFIFNKKSQGYPLPCLFCQYTCCCLKTESLPLFQKFPRKVREWYNVEYFCILSSDKSSTAQYFSHNFWSQGSMMNLAFFTDYTVLADCCYVCIVCICLLFNDSI